MLTERMPAHVDGAASTGLETNHVPRTIAHELGLEEPLPEAFPRAPLGNAAGMEPA